MIEDNSIIDIDSDSGVTVRKNKSPMKVKESFSNLTNPRNQVYNHNNVLFGGNLEEMIIEDSKKSTPSKMGADHSKKITVRFKKANNGPNKVSYCCICSKFFFLIIATENIEIEGVLRCGHKFCYSCIVYWSKHCNTCPLCKSPFNIIVKERCGEKLDYTEIKDFFEIPEIPPAFVENSKNYFYLLADTKCYVCDKDDKTESMLVCDKCNFKICHNFCLSPPIDYIPAGNWYCDECCSVNFVFIKESRA